MWLDLQEPSLMAHLVFREILYWNIKTTVFPLCYTVATPDLRMRRAVLWLVFNNYLYCVVITVGFWDNLFYSPCNITHIVYRGGWVGGQAEGGFSAIRALTVVLSPQQVTDMCTTHRMGRGGHCWQFDTRPTLITAPQWPHRPCNAPMRLYRVNKKPSVKADLV